jgi:hypothetical protein
MSIDISVAGIFSFVDALNKLEYMKAAGTVNNQMSDGV